MAKNNQRQLGIQQDKTVSRTSLELTHVVKVLAEFLEARVSLAPVPRAVHLWETQPIKWQLGIDSSTWVTVQSPDATKVRGGIKELDVVAHFAEFVQVVHTRKATAHN